MTGSGHIAAAAEAARLEREKETERQWFREYWAEFDRERGAIQ